MFLEIMPDQLPLCEIILGRPVTFVRITDISCATICQMSCGTSGLPQSRGYVTLARRVIIEPVNGHQTTVCPLNSAGVTDVVIAGAVPQDDLITPRYSVVSAELGTDAVRLGSIPVRRA